MPRQISGLRVYSKSNCSKRILKSYYALLCWAALGCSAPPPPSADYHKRGEGELSERCLGIEAMLQHNLLTYTSQPIPVLGRVDLAAVFFNRERFAAENVLFGKLCLHSPSHLISYPYPHPQPHPHRHTHTPTYTPTPTSTYHP